MSDEGPNNKVVVVEDDPTILEMLADELREQGFHPLTLRRGGMVVKVVKEEKPGCVILDLSLPDRDGIHILRELKDDWDAKKIPVIVMSAYTGRLDHTGRANAEAVFAKPFELHEIMNAVRFAVMRPKD
jgi:DNA-binding response OmpR family regulator